MKYVIRPILWQKKNKITEPSYNVEFFLLGTVKEEVNNLDLRFIDGKQFI